MQDKNSAGSSTVEGLVAVFIEPEDEIESGRFIGLTQWRTKRAPGHQRVGRG